MKISQFLILISVAFISGCAAQLTFIDRTDGSIHLGTSGSTASSGGEANVTIAGVLYRGPWVYSASGGGYSIGNAFGSASVVRPGGTYTAFGAASSTAVIASAQGNELINLRADNGTFMRCVFSFNGLSSSGIGQCQRNDGREFDLTIKR